MSGAPTPIMLSANGLGAVIFCTASSGTTRVPLVGDGDALVVTNDGSYVGYLALGGDTVTAVAPIAPGATASYPILVGTKEDQISSRLTDGLTGCTHVAGICKPGETTVLIVHRVQR